MIRSRTMRLFLILWGNVSALLNFVGTTDHLRWSSVNFNVWFCFVIAKSVGIKLVSPQAVL